MEDVQELIKTIRDWRQETVPSSITNSLIKLKKINFEQKFPVLENVLKNLVAFHKEITKASDIDASLVPMEWYCELMATKKVLRVIEKKQRVKIYQHEHRLITKTNINEFAFPQDLLEEKSRKKRQAIKDLYKNFIMNMEERLLSENQGIVRFLQKVLECLYEQFKDHFKIGGGEQNTPYPLFERIKKIGQEFHSSSTRSKQEMIQGKMDPRKISTAEPQSFICEYENNKRIERQIFILNKCSHCYYPF